jgi:NitT/TauT family transport system permease protein
MICQPTTKKWNIFLGISSIFVMLTMYGYMSHRQHKINPNDTSVPGISLFKEGFVKSHTLQKREDAPWILEDSKATLTRLSIGWSLSVVTAIILGILMGCYPKIESFFFTPLSLFKQAPPTAMIAVFFILLGTDMQLYVGIIIFGVVPILSFSICLFVKEVHQENIYKSYTLSASNMETICHIIFPTILPKIIDAARLQIGPAIVYLIAAEMISADTGFGFRLRLQSRLINMNVVYIYIAYIAMFGFFMDFVLIKMQKILCPWHAKK